MKLRARLALATAAVSLPMVLALVWWDARSRRHAAEEELVELARHLAATPGWLAQCEAAPASWRGGGAGPGAPPPARRPGLPMRPGQVPPEPPAMRPGQAPPEPPARRPGLPPEPPAMRPGQAPPEPPAMRPGPPPAMNPGPRPGGVGPAAHRRPAQFFAYDRDLRPWHVSAPVLSSEVRTAMSERTALSLTEAWQDALVHVLVRVPGEPRDCVFLLAEGTIEPWLGGILPPTQIWLLPLVAVLAAVLIATGPVVARIRTLTAAARRSAESEYESGVALGGSDEVAELAHALDDAAKRVREQLASTRRSEAALREFLANTTHDLMLPLTVLQGHLSAMQQLGAAQPGANGASEASETMASAMNEAHYLGALIHNLGIAAKLDSGAPGLEVAEVNLGALVERVVSRHRPLARNLGVELDRAVSAEPLLVHADVTLLEQAVGNLVYNAVRYNHAGGHVAIIAEAEAEHGFSLRVLDDGPGMSEAEVARAVERGVRGDHARTRAPDGHGLGLHISSRVAELHGFTLRFGRSEYGGLLVELTGTRQS